MRRIRVGVANALPLGGLLHEPVTYSFRNCSGPLRVASTTCTGDARTVGNSTPRSHS